MSEARKGRAAIYIRVSSSAQEQDGTSLQTQEERCRAYAAERGMVVDQAHFYREVHTGVQLWERPQLTALRAAMRAREVETVVSFAIDRLARDPVHLGLILTEAEHAGVAVAFVTEPLDDSPEGALIRFVRGYAAKIEHIKLLERTIRGRQARARAGKLLATGKPLYGYRWKDEGKSAYETDPETAAVVRRIFAGVLSGQTLHKVARDLTQDGIPTPSAQAIPWRQTTISKLLHHPGYGGQAFAYRSITEKASGTKKGKKQTVREQEGWVRLPDGTIPPIVDMPTWEAAQKILATNEEHAGRSTAHPEDYLLRSGFIVCGYCGWPMHAGQANGGQPNYICGAHKYKKGYCSRSGSIRAAEIDPAAWGVVERILTQPGVIGEQLEKLRGNDPTSADVAAVERALLDTSRKQLRLVDALADLDVDSAEAVKMKLSALSAQKKQLQVEWDVLMQRRETWRTAQSKLDDLERWCHEVGERLGDFGYDQQRVVLQALGIQVKLYRADHEPRYEITATLPIPGEAMLNRTRLL